MYPSKSIMDFKLEMDRLFPRTNENDLYPSNMQSQPTMFNSPIYQTAANQSSSSAESASPDTFPFPDMSFRRPDTPHIRPHRPIIGRKILGQSDPSSMTYRTFASPVIPASRSSESDSEMSPVNRSLLYGSENLFSFPQLTPPRSSDNFMERPSQRHYELFPSDNRYGLNTPIKEMYKPQMQYAHHHGNYSPIVSFSPSRADTAESMSARYQRNVPSSPMSFSARTSPNLPLLPSSSGQTFSYADVMNNQKMCTFCRKNGETPVVFMTHALKEKINNKYVVTCPILRSHVCQTCGASGDNAHTITYCPVLRTHNNGQPLQSTTITLKNTRIKSNGRRRY